MNHASIIDGVRLCKAARYRYENNNMEDLEQQLIKATEAGHRFKLIVTDGVFSMDGLVAPLDKICDLMINMMLWLWLTNVTLQVSLEPQEKER